MNKIIIEQSNLCNICIWFIDDHKIANSDKLVKLSPIDNKTVAAITTWVAVFNDFATSEELQIPDEHCLTLSLIIVGTGSVTPETADRMLKV